MKIKNFIPIPPPADLPEEEEIDIRDITRMYLDGVIDLLCILGPTASGKTRYAVRVAREINAMLSGMPGREGLAGAAETVREVSRLCEQDARRYDGGFPFY